MQKAKQARFELRLTREEKNFFEQASLLAGYKTLSGFVLSAIREYANKIMNDKARILLSQKEKEIFFDAVLSQQEPNEALIKATEEYFDNQN